ncbi:Plasmodium exported protein, unknown function [Plasmodium sp. gorilla clade G3]|nr:Plasmodium exported protein, unknown function [Plasmodium sp. gorilla clade G3]
MYLDKLSTLNVKNYKGLNIKYRVVCILNNKRVDNNMPDEKIYNKSKIGYNVLNNKLNKEYDKYHKNNISLKRNEKKKKKTKKGRIVQNDIERKIFGNVIKNVITGLVYTSLIIHIVM